MNLLDKISNHQLSRPRLRAHPTIQLDISFSDFQERIQRAKAFLQMLPSNISIPGDQGEYNSFWIMPIFIDAPDTMAAKLRQAGFDCARGNRSLFAIDAKPNTPTHLLPIESQDLMEHMLCLPLSNLLTAQELEYLAQLVRTQISNQS